MSRESDSLRQQIEAAEVRVEEARRRGRFGEQLALRFGIVGGMLFMGVFLAVALRRWDVGTVLPWGLLPVLLAIAECVRFIMRPPSD
jgi:hypothetical protein